MSEVKKDARAMSRQTNDLENALSALSLAAPLSSKFSSIPTPASRPLLKEYSETSKTLYSESDNDDYVVDDWEAAADSSSDNEAASSKNNIAGPLNKVSHFRTDSTNGPNVPPPTPISPANSHSGGSPFPFGSPNTASSSIADRFAQSASGYAPSSPRCSSRTTQSSNSRTPALRDPGVRQEKTDAVAKRLIAGALGIKAPKKTEEQRQYDRAVREKEMRRRNEEKERVKKGEEEKERAKAAMWED